MKYELIHEIFNQCSGNQMRDVFVREVETDDPEGYVRDLVKGTNITITLTHAGGGEMIFDVDADGLRQRFSFTED